MRHCDHDSSGVDRMDTRLPTRLTIAIDTHGGRLNEIGICHAVLLEFGNWEFLAKGVHFSIEYPPNYIPPGRSAR